MNKLYAFAAVAALIPGIAGCCNDSKSESQEYKGKELTFADHFVVTPIADRVVSLGTYTSIDEDKALADIENLSFAKGGCSSCCKVLDNGDLIFGRNMDLSISEENVYLFKTSYGKYQTKNIMYFYGLGPTYAEILKNQLDEGIANLIPYMSLDMLNEKGLYMATNMRPSEYDAQGNNIFATTGTNPGKKRIFAGSVPQYVGTRCANIEEMLAELENLDVFTTTSFLDWPLGMIVGDATGRHGVLEFVNNEAVFTEGADINTNFFIDEKYRAMEKGAQGFGRYDVIKNGLPAVKGENDMHNLMAQIYYSYMFRDVFAGTPYLHADFRSDFALSIPVNDKGEVDYVNGKNENSTLEWMMDEKNEEAVYQAMYKVAKMFLVDMDEAQRRASHGLWYSTIHNITNVNKGTMTVQLWEDRYITFTMN